MDKPLWFDHFENAINAGYTWDEAAQIADQAVADEDAMFMDAAVDAAKEVF